MIDIHAVKEAAVVHWLGRDGVVGIGIGGPTTLHIYVAAESDVQRFSDEFRGAKVKVIVTGPIMAAGGREG